MIVIQRKVEEHEDKLKKFKEILGTGKEIFIVFPIFIYILGFAYTQGAFSPIKGSSVVEDALYPIYPFSYDVYIFRGLIITLGLIIPSLFIALLLVNIFKMLNLKRKNNYKLKLMLNGLKTRYKTAYTIIRFCIKMMQYLLIMILSLIIMIAPFGYNIGLLFGRNFIVNNGITINPNFFLFYFTFLFLLIYFYVSFFMKYFTGDNKFWLFKMVYLLMFMLSTLISVYYFGQFVQDGKLKNFISGSSQVKIANIQTIDSVTSSTYLFVDFNKDMFLGYDKGKNIVIIPTNKIKSIVINE